MTKVVGDIAVTVGADVSDLEKAMKRGSNSVNRFGQDTDRMSAKMAKFAARTATVAAATGVIAAGFGRMSGAAVAAGAEIERMSKIANSAPEDFQKLARAAETVGFESSKVSDVLKDVNEKVGDFLATGGGELKDFFEDIAPTVGVTADSFRDLTGTQALQLYVDTLERARTPHVEMIAHLEALANDASALIPLLSDNGRELNRLGNAAERAGTIMSNSAVQGASDLQVEMNLLSDVMKTRLHEQFLDNKEDIAAIVELINGGLIPALGGVISLVGTVAQGYQKWGEAIDTVRSRLGMNDKPYEGELYTPGINPDGSRPSSDLNDTLSDFGFDGILGGGGSSQIDGGEGSDRLGLGGASGRQEYYENALIDLGDFLNRRLEMIESHQGAEFASISDAANNFAQVESGKYDTSLVKAGDFFGSLSKITKGNSEKLLKIQKAYGLAEAAVSTAVGAANALKLPFPSNLAAFGQVMATGSQAISAIKSSSPGQSGIGGGGAAPSATETAATYYNVSLDGEGSISRSSVRDLIGMINDEIEDGAVISGITVS